MLHSSITHPRRIPSKLPKIVFAFDTEAEFARDIHAVLAKVHEGVEVIVEQDHYAVVFIRTPRRSGRPI